MEEHSWKVLLHTILQGANWLGLGVDNVIKVEVDSGKRQT